MPPPRNRPRLAAALLSSAAVSWPAPRAQAQAPERPVFALVFHAKRDVGDACADSELFSQEVAARLGYSPFSPDAPGSVRVDLELRLDRVEARVLLERPPEPPFERSLEEDPAHCTELVRALAVVVSSAIDPLGAGATPARPPLEPSPPTPPEPPRAPPEDTERPPTWNVRSSEPPDATRLRAVFGASALGGVVPSDLPIAFGLEVGLASDWSPGFRLHAHVSWSPPNGVENDRGSVEAQRLVASLAPCFRRSFFEGCARATAGVLVGHGREVAEDLVDVSPQLGLGAQAAITIPLGSRLDLALGGVLEAALVRADLQTNDVTVWSAPLLSGGGTLLLGVAL